MTATDYTEDEIVDVSLSLRRKARMENEQTSGRLAEVIKSTEAQREIWNSAIDVAAKECGFQSLAGGKKDVHEEYRRGCKDCLMAVDKLKDRK